MNIGIVNYEAGNIGSIKYALEQCGLPSYIVADPDALKQASHIIFPGVGSFHKAMTILREKKLDIALQQAVLEKGIPFLGICLGMQLLATKGEEGGGTEGLDLIPGKIKLLATKKEVRLPHVGWNDVHLNLPNPLFANINSLTDFYFLHSYCFQANSDNHVIANVEYGSVFPAAIKKNNIMGVQFHPEKSGKIGRQLLKNFTSF